MEVQILGDIHGAIAHLGERECSVQRTFQKIIEVAPAPGLAADLRARIIDAAVRFADSVGYSNAGTFEFLVDVSGNADGQAFAFIETNARLQVEHTVTEAVTGVDIVQAQIRLAAGATIADLGLDRPQVHAPRGSAIQARGVHGIDSRRWVHLPIQRQADRLRGPERTGRAHGWIWLRRLPDQSVI